MLFWKKRAFFIIEMREQEHIQEYYYLTESIARAKEEVVSLTTGSYSHVDRKHLVYHQQVLDKLEQQMIDFYPINN